MATSVERYLRTDNMSREEKKPEEYKELGNEAFAKQDFTKAIEYYTKAIELDSKNHVFFSNRSASYAGTKDWTKAVEDAKECIRLNPQFVKGYYRLATAQLEMEEYDLAQATIKQGLTLDANNNQLLKVLRTIKQARKAATTAVYAPQKKLDTAASRELYDLQVQHSQASREYNTVQANLNKTQREHKMNEITLQELEANPSSGGYYKSVGKIFMKSTSDRVLDNLKSSMEEQKKKETDLKQKIEYLERRIKSQEQNMQELASSGE